MRKLVHVIGIVLALLSTGALAFFEQPSEEDKTIQEIYEVPGADKAKILGSAKAWIAENFRSARSVIDHEDLAEGLLLAKPVIPYPCSGFNCIAKGDWLVSFTMRMDIKDERYRLTFTNVLLHIPAPTVIGQKSEYQVIRPKLLAIGEGIKATVLTPKSKADW